MPALGQLPRPCDCFLRSHIYIDSVDGVIVERHFRYADEDSFRSSQAQAQLRRSLGPARFELLVAAVKQEHQRRITEDTDAAARKKELATLYEPRDARVRTLRPLDLHNVFLAILDDAEQGRVSGHIEVSEGGAVTDLAKGGKKNK